VNAPLYAMVGTDFRRDLLYFGRHTERLRLLHFYQRAPYNDLAADELAAGLRHYGGPLDLGVQLWRARPDILQGVDPFVLRLLPLLYVVFVVALLRCRPLVLVTLENRPLAEKYHWGLALLLRLALRPILGYAALIIYLNEGARRNLLWAGADASKTRYLMYGTWGVDPGEFSPKGERRDLGQRPALLFVGRLDAAKGVFDLVDALALLRRQHPTAQLTLVGAGPDRERLERRIAELGLAHAVTLTGTVLNRELPAYLRGADVFIAPSRTTRKWEEQVGMTIIQALACGLPTVATRSGAIPEYLPDGEAGLLVPEGSPQALAGAIAAVLASAPLRERLGRAGQALARSRYNAAENARVAEEVILSLLDKPDAKRRG
jgi:glycosyltransferase involved in cell wall biosynthesis